MYKVLALDLDGTVLTDNHTILPQVKAAIQEAQQHCHVVIVTGRHHTAARPYYVELGLNTPIICCNGTYVYDYKNEQVITHNAIDKETALEFIALAGKHNAKLVMYVTDAMTYERQAPIAYMQTLEDWAQTLPENIRPNIYKIESIPEEANTTQFIWKFVVEAEPSAVELLVQHPLVQTKFNGERSWSNRIDFAAKGNTKGNRLAEYIEQLGFQAKDVIAVGDNHNDTSMIRLAGLGVAMANADDTVKSYADEICQTNNNQDGLAHLIREKIKG